MLLNLFTGRNRSVYQLKKRVKKFKFREKFRIVYINKTDSYEGSPIEGIIENDDLVVIGLMNSNGLWRGFIKKYFLDSLPVGTLYLGGEYIFSSFYPPKKEGSKKTFKINDISYVKSYHSWFF